MSEIGHNSGDDPVQSDQLKSIVERIERLEEEKRETAQDIREVYAEAKGNGYQPKIIRQIIAERRRDADERAEEAAIKALYYEALDMFA